MRFEPCPLPGAWRIMPEPHTDERGRFFRAWCVEEFRAHDIGFTPVQANMGTSARRGTIRGLHYQDDSAPEAKLIRCTHGAIWDVVVDLRPGSPTLGRWYATELSAADAAMVYVPPLCAHGYQTLADDTEIHYMASAPYTPAAVRGIRFDDPALGITWPLAATAVSPQDRAWPALALEGPGGPA